MAKRAASRPKPAKPQPATAGAGGGRVGGVVRAVATGANAILKNQDRIKNNYHIDPNRGQFDNGWDAGRGGIDRDKLNKVYKGLTPDERKAFRTGYAAGSAHSMTAGGGGGAKAAPKAAPSPKPGKSGVKRRR